MIEQLRSEWDDLVERRRRVRAEVRARHYAAIEQEVEALLRGDMVRFAERLVSSGLRKTEMQEVIRTKDWGRLRQVLGVLDRPVVVDVPVTVGVGEDAPTIGFEVTGSRAGVYGDVPVFRVQVDGVSPVEGWLDDSLPWMPVTGAEVAGVDWREVTRLVRGEYRAGRAGFAHVGWDELVLPWEDAHGSFRWGV